MWIERSRDPSPKPRAKPDAGIARPRKRLRGIAVASLLALVCSPLPAAAEAHELLLPEWKPEVSPEDSKTKQVAAGLAEFTWSFANDTLTDSWSIAKSPLSWRWKGWLTAAAVAGGTVGLLYGVDQDVRERSQSNEAFMDFGREVRFLGNGPGLAALTGGFALSGWYFDRPKELETARLLLEASLSGVLFVHTGKAVLGRSRPNSERGPKRFRPFSGNVSMPSGETASAFIMAGVVTSQYPQWYVQLISYSLAGAVGAGRIGLDAHWTSDVFLSAALGIGISKAVVHFSRKRKEERERLEALGSSRRVRKRHYFAITPRSFHWTVVF